MATMRVLVIEDDSSIGNFVERSLQQSGLVVDLARTAKRGEQLFLENEYAALILDLGLPDADGFDLLASLRGQGLSAPVLILSARRSVDDRVRGLEQGGDDYLVKPFAIAELQARLRNLLKRSQATAPATSTRLSVLDLELDLLRREAARGTRQLRLTAQEFALLEYLCRNAGRVVTRAMIMDHVWKVRIDPDTNVVDVHIYRLRSKVDAEGETPLIRTLRGVGYVLKDR
jgi:DNA-binding response OmpR family regulator